MTELQPGAYELYGDHRSGNCWKAALALHLAGQPCVWRETDVVTGATHTPEFLALNPNGKVPLLRLPDGRLLAESNAMLLHLCEGTPLVPADSWQRALVYQWLFFEQYSHEPYIAVARFLLHFDHGRTVDPGHVAMLQQRGRAALAVMEQALRERSFLVGDERTVADIALYAYTHVAADGGFDLDEFPAVVEWLARMRRQPGHFDLADLPIS